MTPFCVDAAGVAVGLAIQLVVTGQDAQAHHVGPFTQGDARAPVSVDGIERALSVVVTGAHIGSGKKTQRRIDLVADVTAEGVSQITGRSLNASRVQGENQVAQSRHRDLAFTGGVIDVAVVADAGFEIACRLGFLCALDLFDCQQIVIDGRLGGRRRILRQHGLEFSLGAGKVAQLIIGTSHVKARAGKIGIGCEHAFECERSLVRFAAVERGDAEKIVELDVAGFLKLERFEQGVGFGGFALFHQGVRFVKIRARSQRGVARHPQTEAQSKHVSA